MKPSLQEFLFNLLKAQSPSGSEETVVSLLSDYISPFVSEIRKDALGNCIALKKGKGNTKIMLMAHADEIGFMINHIDNNGFIYFKCIGCIDCSILPTHKVSILGKEGPVSGIIGKKPIHLQNGESSNNNIQPEDLWIDIGVRSREEAESLVSIGDVATLLSSPIIIQNDLLAAKSIDDRIGIAILAGVAEMLDKTDLDSDVYYVASTQEEIGARGAQVATTSILPDVGIALDVTHATDYPTMSAIKDGNITLGGGVVIPTGPNMNKEINKSLIAIASKEGIAFQNQAIAGPTQTDVRIIQIVGTGVKTGLLSIPCRYVHTPNEIISIKDVDSTVSLLVEYLKCYCASSV